LLAQCANFEIKVSKLDACAPEVIKYYVTNAPAGSLFEWDIAVIFGSQYTTVGVRKFLKHQKPQKDGMVHLWAKTVNKECTYTK
jgi:hypothetical protein